MAGSSVSSNPLNRDSNFLEHVSPFKMCVYVLLKEYCLMKRLDKAKHPIRRILFEDGLKPDFKRDFCLLAIYLTLSPDMEYLKLIELLHSGKYKLVPELVNNFKSKMNLILIKDLGYISDAFFCFNCISESLILEESSFNKKSLVGIYMRRIFLNYRKLEFDQTQVIYKKMTEYVQYQKVEMEGNEETDIAGGDAGSSAMVTSDSEGEESALQMDEASDMSGVFSHRPSTSLPHQSVSLSPPTNIPKSGVSRLWSKQQVDQFVRGQVRLMEKNSPGVLAPVVLDAVLREVLRTSSDHTDAHFLNYLNYVRSRELNGAIDSLYHFFDIKLYSNYEEDKTKGLRLAALNLGILYAIFEKTTESISALNEAVTLSHEANDTVCLQYAQTWLYRLKNEKRELLIEKSLNKSQELNMTYLLAFGHQAFAQHSAYSRQAPSTVFEVVSLSESLGCQHQMDLVVGGCLAQRAALWALYGQPLLSALAAQQLLHIASEDSPLNTAEPTLAALANLAHHFTIRGEFEEGSKVIALARSMQPSSKKLIWCEALLTLEQTLHKGLWQKAAVALSQLALIDSTEALLRDSEIMLVKGDCEGALAGARKVLQSESPVCRVRALLVMARACQRAPGPLLAQALHLAHTHHLHYYSNLIIFYLLQLQVVTGMGVAEEINGSHADSALRTILSHGCCAHISDALFKKAQAIIVAKKDSHSALPILDESFMYAKKINDYSRLKNIAHLQAVLCDKLSLLTDRNRYAFQFRSLDEQFSSFNASLKFV